MLYVTTRNKDDAFTAIHALKEWRGKCGGLYVPYRLPVLSQTAITELQSISFGERVARILNLFFNTNLIGADVEFAIGKRPVRVAAMNHKIAVIEAWHNHAGDFDVLVASLYQLIAKETPTTACTPWFRIAVRISVLFAIFADLMKVDIATISKRVDVSTAVGDFTAPMAAWYARKMGLPIGKIICSCEDDSRLWEFFHNGSLTTGDVGTTSVNQVPVAIENLIFEKFGFDLTHIYVQRIASGKHFRLNDEQRIELSNEFFCAVVRPQRVESIILNQHNTNQYWMDSATALAFGGLQDYRVSSSETGTVLILSDRRSQQ